MDQNLDYDKFLQSHSILIAPAGFGKTHTIAECLKKVEGVSLVLTHTNAGVASIKHKCKKLSVSSSTYNIETILGYMKKYCEAYLNEKLPEIDESEYRNNIGDFILNLLNYPFIQETILRTYDRVFVDEYQDCTIKQHDFVKKISERLPIHILGDPMQSIYGFKGEPIIDLDNKKDSLLELCYKNKHILKTPYRWKNCGSESLGLDIRDIREKLEDNQVINLNHYHSINTILKENDNTSPIRALNQIFNKEENKNILIIDPSSESTSKRLNSFKKYAKTGRIKFLEAIDSKEFYVLAKQTDTILEGNFRINLFNFLCNFYSKSILKKRMKEDGKFVKKKGEKNRKIAEDIKRIVNGIEETGKLRGLDEILSIISKADNNYIYRYELFCYIRESIVESFSTGKTVFDGIIDLRNKLRKIGRILKGRNWGTTLLTKGLESDVVIVMDANNFKDPKHFYVAISRSCKELHLVSDTTEISFKQQINKGSNNQLKLF